MNNRLKMSFLCSLVGSSVFNVKGVGDPFQIPPFELKKTWDSTLRLVRQL